MKKIVAICGSKNQASKSYEYVNCVIKKITTLSTEIESVIYSPMNTNIQMCVQCYKCFTDGICLLDEQDSMGKIKKDLLNADFILWATPVYFHNVSAFNKLIIDRLSYWAHLFRLLGKPGISIISAYNNGFGIVSDYMNKVFTYLGIHNVATVYLGLANGHFDDKIDEYVDQIIMFVDNKKLVDATPEIEAIFKSLQLIFSHQNPENVEYQYWKKNGYFDVNSYQDLLNKRLI